MSSKRYAAVSLAAALSFTYAVPAFANTSDPVENVFVNQYATVEKTIENVSDVISNSLDSIEIEKTEPVEVVNEVIYQPEVTYVVEYVSEPVMTTYTVPVEWVSAPEEADTSAINEAQAAYDAALAAYNQAQAEYEAASQMIETTKEVEVEVTEEIEDEEDNIVTQTRTEIQTITETAYAGDVESAQANLDAAATALEAASANLAEVQNQSTEAISVKETETTEEDVYNSTSSGIHGDVIWSLNDDGLLIISPHSGGEITSGQPWGSDVKTIVIEEGVETIGESAFQNSSNLISITLPSTITTIGDFAFYGCEKLENINLPEGITNIGIKTFFGCENLSEAVLPSSLTTISDYAFYRCTGLTDMVIPESVTSIGKKAFYGCTGLTKMVIPSSVSSLGEGAFYACEGLTYVELPSGIERIEESTFHDCINLETAILPDTLMIIGDYAFYNCRKLKKAGLSWTINTIGKSAFEKTENLTYVYFYFISNIGDYAFRSSGINTIYYGFDQETWKQSVTLGEQAIPDPIKIYYLEEDPCFTGKKYSLSLDGSIGFNYFYGFGKPVLDDEDAVFKINLNGESYITLIKDAPTRMIDGVKYSCFSIDLASVQMADDLWAYPLLSNGFAISTVFDQEYSIQSYGELVMRNTEDEDLIQLIRALLNYGGYAQKFFNYNTENLANKNLYDIDVSDVTAEMLEPHARVISGSEVGLNYISSSLAMEDLTTINHYFTVEKGHTIDEYQFISQDAEIITPVKCGNKYVVSIPNIASTDLDTRYTISVGGFDINYSALSYAYTVLTSDAATSELKDLARALYKYNRAADNYF